MATQNMPGIKNSWSLIAFAKAYGKPMLTQPREFVNSDTGESFTARSLAFEHPTEKDDQGRNKVTFVGFSRNLGEISAKEIAERAEDLRVLEYENGHYGLCAKGADAWEDIDLGL